LGRIFDGKDPDGPMIHILTNAADVKGLPIVYTIQRTKIFLRQFPNRPRNRMATLSNEGGIISMISNMIDLLQLDKKHNAVRHFKTKERDQAIAWLLEDR